jgi:hypothetical protein
MISIKQAKQKIRMIGIYLLKNFHIVLFLYNYFYKVKNKEVFHSEITKRASLSIFNYEELAQPIPYYPIESVKDSNYYGHFHWLKKYTKKNSLNYSIEHGLYLGNYVPYATFLRTVKSIITLSEHRKQHLINANVAKPIIAIGPYIHYSSSLLDADDFLKLKKELGKTFLLFPSHSIKNFETRMDVQKLIKSVKELSSGYDTIMVCLFYKDILDGAYSKYFSDEGFKIVTAGNRFDLNFISRLKSIIMLADYTASNTVGTHTGYCIYLNKPHYIIRQEIEVTQKDGSPVEHFRNADQLKSLEEEEEEIRNAFSVPEIEITKQQRAVIDKYWGISSIKPPEELLRLFNNQSPID